MYICIGNPRARRGTAYSVATASFLIAHTTVRMPLANLHAPCGMAERTARASFALYNTHEEVDALAEALHKAIDFFG